MAIKGNKNSAEVDIAPASGKITKNVKYRSRHQVKVCSESVCEGHLLFTFAAITDAEKNFYVKINKINRT